MTLPHDKGVATMGENDGRKVLFIGKEVAAMNVCEGDFVLSPLDLFGDNGSAGLNKLIVCEHQKVGEGCGAHPCPHSGGDDVLQGSVEGEGSL